MRMHRVLRWALVKDAHRRLRHVGDAILELEAAAPSASRLDTEPGRRRWPMVAALVAAAMIAAVIGAAVALRWLPSSADTTSRSASNFTIPVGASEVLPRNAAISPDGRYIAYIAGPLGNQKTYLRKVGDRQSRVSGGVAAAISAAVLFAGFAVGGVLRCGEAEEGACWRRLR